MKPIGLYLTICTEDTEHSIFEPKDLDMLKFRAEQYLDSLDDTM